MIKLIDKPNTQPGSPTFNYGSLIDDDGSGNGTPVNLLVYNDVHQFFETLMAYGAITPNGLIDNDDNGYQLLTAFQAGAKQATKSLMGVLAKTIIGDETLIISGGTHGLLGVTWNVGFTILSPGYIFWNDELFFTGGYTGAIVDTAVFTKVAPNVLVVTDAASGSGDFDYADLTFIQDLGVKHKRLAIGAWDMTSLTGVDVLHGLPDINKILSVSAMIIDDAGALLLELTTTPDSSTPLGGGILITATELKLKRITGGLFDDAAYNGAGNRGYVTVQYVI